MQRDGDAAAAAAASYRVLSRLLGYGTGPEAGAAARPQLMVFRNAATEGRPGEDCGPVAAAAAAAASWGAAAQNGLELQLAALGLRPPGLGAKGAAGTAGTPCPPCAPCPCLGPPAGEETSDALLVLEALEPDEGGSGSEDEPGSPGRGAARAAGRAAAAAAAPGPAPPPTGTGTGPGGRKGSLRIRLSRLFRTKSCSGGSATGDAASAAGSAGSLTDVSGARGREQEPGRKHRLTRTQSAFSPAVFSPLFTGETVSLVDVDISQRGLSSPHPPTPPPPPRRSLTVLEPQPLVIINSTVSMEHYRGTFSLWCHPKFEDRCQSVVEFIKRAIMHSKNGKFLYFLRSRVPGELGMGFPGNGDSWERGFPGIGNFLQSK
ncbi:PREDICTED: suppressor of cytokine signaling 7 [Sturnus vulgaris]|uniref:suppressor of cytokine signaling 7 n=1 Tax=Sturnus vulgaris TaxID=9172 RepID=UPI00071A12B5|nr:PREDICTED: suppressor of cytokine signaling 7 [Sturnus vulgaris]